MNAHRLERVENDGLAAAEDGALERPSSMTAKDRALEIREGKIGLTKQLPHTDEPGCFDAANVMLDQRLPGDGDSEGIRHDRSFPCSA
ncbi:hypothetical protein AKG11_32535 [Shinella sp. SUS2]|nr:hypothetical protein AKG11_32535 [Shinella sp. SUS2]KOC71538.1 hypothetical protein AKG10_32470 [Shinella sp. GWS1]